MQLSLSGFPVGLRLAHRLSCIQNIFIFTDFAQQCLNTIAYDDSPTPSPLLREWARAKLVCSTWKDAFVTAGDVSVVPVLC